MDISEIPITKTKKGEFTQKYLKNIKYATLYNLIIAEEFDIEDRFYLWDKILQSSEKNLIYSMGCDNKSEIFFKVHKQFKKYKDFRDSRKGFYHVYESTCEDDLQLIMDNITEFKDNGYFEKLYKYNKNL